MQTRGVCGIEVSELDAMSQLLLTCVGKPIAMTAGRTPKRASAELTLIP